MIAAQASLTDYQKMVAELFDNKISGLGFSALFIALSRGMSLDEFVHYDFLTNMAAFDGGIATWKEKVRHDAVRPVSAIRHLYRNRRITGWAGPGRGVVDDLPGVEWRSYLNTGNHPEYPSGSSCFCAAHAQASRRYLGSDAFGWSVPVLAGSSVIEPGVTPATDLTLGPWNTFTEFEDDCSRSRVWGGVHFVAGNDRRTEDVPSDWRSCVRVPPASRARNGEVATGKRRDHRPRPGGLAPAGVRATWVSRAWMVGPCTTM